MSYLDQVLEVLVVLETPIALLLTSLSHLVALLGLGSAKCSCDDSFASISSTSTALAVLGEAHTTFGSLGLGHLQFY